MFGLFNKQEPPQPPAKFPPVPKWRPSFAVSNDQVIDRIAYYTDRKKDFAVFTHGTCVILPSGLSNAEAESAAESVLHKIFHFHPDMNPRKMDDDNIAIQYNQPAINVVIVEFAKAHWVEIDRNHQDALAASEVLITPLGPNKFDDFGKMALFGRCYMFMDAQKPQVIRVVRSGPNT
jgi:hypothetical protein